MKRKYNILALLFVCLLSLSLILFGCGKDDTSSNDESGDVSVGDNSVADISGDESAAVSDDESADISDVSDDISEDGSAELSGDASEEVGKDTSIDESDDTPSKEESEPLDPEKEMAKVEVPVLSITLHDQFDRVHQSYYVKATIQLKDPSNQFETIKDRNAEIKIRGNSTSSGIKKPYNIRFSESHNVLGLGKGKKWYLIANLYDKTLMRNKLAYDLAQVLGLTNTSKCTYVDVYLNGKFLGNYLLCESIGVGEDRVDINIDNNEFLFEYEPWVGYSNPNAFSTPYFGILLGYNDRDNATAQQKQYLNDFFKKAEMALSNRNWSDIQKYFDIDSFVNHYLLNEFFKNVDIGTSSTRYYLKGGKLYAGPVWDLDLSSGNCDWEYYGGYNNVYGSGDSTEGIYSTVQWYRYLIDCPEFLQLVKDRLVEMNDYFVNLYAKNNLGYSRIDVLLTKYGDSFNRNFTTAGWNVSEWTSILERRPDPTYEANVDYLRTWLEKRHKWLLNYWGIKIN